MCLLVETVVTKFLNVGFTDVHNAAIEVLAKFVDRLEFSSPFGSFE